MADAAIAPEDARIRRATADIIGFRAVHLMACIVAAAAIVFVYAPGARYVYNSPLTNDGARVWEAATWFSNWTEDGRLPLKFKRKVDAFAASFSPLVHVAAFPLKLVGFATGNEFLWQTAAAMSDRCRPRYMLDGDTRIPRQCDSTPSCLPWANVCFGGKEALATAMFRCTPGRFCRNPDQYRITHVVTIVTHMDRFGSQAAGDAGLILYINPWREPLQVAWALYAATHFVRPNTIMANGAARRVFVACDDDATMSVAVAMAYLVAAGQSYDDALVVVRRHRPDAALSDTARHVLHLYEETRNWQQVACALRCEASSTPERCPVCTTPTFVSDPYRMIVGNDDAKE